MVYYIYVDLTLVAKVYCPEMVTMTVRSLAEKYDKMEIAITVKCIPKEDKNESSGD